MKKLLVTALLVAASLLVVGTTLTAGASAKASTCKTVKYNETKLVWNAKHTKKIKVVVTKLVKETVKVHGKLKTSYVEVPVVKSVKICTAAKKATAPTTTVPAQTAPAPVTTVPVTTVASPTSTTTTTTVPPTTTTFPQPEAIISTVFVNPQGVVQVTGQFVNVTSLTFCTQPISPPVSVTDPIPTAPDSPSLSDACTPTVNHPTVGNFCSAEIVSSSGVQSAECTLPGYTGYLGNPINLSGAPPGLAGCSGACLTIAWPEGATSFYCQENNPSSPSTTRYWEYPVPVVPVQPIAEDGPVGAVSVMADPSAPTTESIVTITGVVTDYPDVAGSTALVGPNPQPGVGTTFPNTPPVATPIGNPNPSTQPAVVSIIVGEPISYLETNSFQIGWSGGTNYDTQYGFPSLAYWGWNTNEIVAYDSTSGTWYIAAAPTLYAAT
jgi:hypothetical protein